MNVLSLFAGIGGFDLALERAGLTVVAQCEISAYPRSILQMQWPDVPCYEDVRDVTREKLTADGIGSIDVICGGTPCQPASVAGKRAGTDDDRWLWGEAIRTVREFAPKWAIFENVDGLLTLDGGMAFESICTQLEDEGYEVQSYFIPAVGVGAVHRRSRVWIVAHSGAK